MKDTSWDLAIRLVYWVDVQKKNHECTASVVNLFFFFQADYLLAPTESQPRVFSVG